MTPRYLSQTETELKSDNNEKSEIEENHTLISFPKKEDCRILIVGCGNSALGEDMLIDGWTGGITNIDYSTVVIEQMREKYNDEFYKKLQSRVDRERKLNNNNNNAKKKDGKPDGDSNTNTNKVQLQQMKFECADLTKPLPFADGSFDLIMCKGALDSILCSNGSVSSARLMMEECSRVLDPTNGVMFVVTYGNPENRLVYFENKENEWWNGGVDVQTVPKPRIPMKSVEDKDMLK